MSEDEIVAMAGLAVPYTIKISRTDFPIFDGPGYDYTYAGTVQAAGSYTIVEEKLDYGWICG